MPVWHKQSVAAADHISPGRSQRGIQEGVAVALNLHSNSQMRQTPGLCSDPYQFSSGHGHFWIIGSPSSAIRVTPLVGRHPLFLPLVSLFSQTYFLCS